jgi:hypothetical protein
MSTVQATGMSEMEIKKMVDKKKNNKGFKIVNCWVIRLEKLLHRPVK